MSKGFRNFFITFILALIAFGFIAYKMVPSAVDFFLTTESEATSRTESADDISDPSEDTSADESPDVSQPVDEIKGTSFTTLVLGTDMYDNIDAAMLVKVNKETKTYLIVSIPTDMQLQIDGVQQKLKTLLRSRDITFFKEKITAITGLQIDFYAVFDINGLIKTVDKLDNVYFNIPYDMFYEDPEQDLVIDLKKGRTKLNGEIVSKLVRFVPTTGETGRLELQRDLVQSMLVQVLTMENVSKAPSLIEALVSNSNTNITLQALNSNTELIFKYASFSKQVIQYPGSMRQSGEETYFEPDVARAVSMFQTQK